MRSLLKRFQKPEDPEVPRKTAPQRAPVALRPARPLYVIGDLHGQSEPLLKTLSQVDAHMHQHKRENPLMVFVGDLIDRGEDSAGVLRRIHAMAKNLPDNVVCLMGNHERMMLDFLDNPTERGARWLRNGGLQTAASYGLRGAAETMPGPALVDLAQRLRAALPDGAEAWLRGLPLSYQSGNVLCVHAAADPDLPANAQSPKVLMWGKGSFLQQDRRDDICVVHGHTVVDRPEHHPTRIAVDTGAYFSGQLTTAAIGPDGRLDFLQT